VTQTTAKDSHTHACRATVVGLAHRRSPRIIKPYSNGLGSAVEFCVALQVARDAVGVVFFNSWNLVLQEREFLLTALQSALKGK
jgi:hypothetical protein